VPTRKSAQLARRPHELCKKWAVWLNWQSDGDDPHLKVREDFRNAWFGRIARVLAAGGLRMDSRHRSLSPNLENNMTVCLPPGAEPGVAPLRIFPPRERSIREELEPAVPRGFDELDAAFQLLTGWRLAWNPFAARTGGHPSRTRHDWLRIDDLSDVLPPGIPAASRIYCENLAMRLNRFLDEWTILRSAGGGGIQFPAPGAAAPGYRLACHLDHFSIEPLRLPDAGSAAGTACEWAMTPNNRVAAGLFAINPKHEMAGAGLTAARSAFVTGARAGADCEAILAHIDESIEQLFYGDLEIEAVVWTLDPAIGEGHIIGRGSFDLHLDREPLAWDGGRACRFPWYRRQLLVAARFHPAASDPTIDGQRDRWMDDVSSVLARREPDCWQGVLEKQFARSIPSYEVHPDLALAMARH
jgi:hypothetical protein